MSTITTVLDPVEIDLYDEIDFFNSEDPGMVHAVCSCEPDYSFCGLHIPGEEGFTTDATDCIVCAQLFACERCGKINDAGK